MVSGEDVQEPPDEPLTSPNPPSSNSAGAFRSKHLSAILALSAKNRAAQEAKQQEEERKERNRQALRSRVLRELPSNGSSSLASRTGAKRSTSCSAVGIPTQGDSAKRSTSCSVVGDSTQGYNEVSSSSQLHKASSNGPVAKGETAITDGTEAKEGDAATDTSAASGSGNADSKSRSWGQACNKNVEMLANHGIEMVKRKMEVQRIKEQRRKLQRAWVSHRARQHTLNTCCQDEEVLQYALGKLTTPPPVPPKPLKPKEMPSVSEASESSPHTCEGCAFPLFEKQHYVCVECLRLGLPKEVFLCVDCYPMREHLHTDEDHCFEDVSNLPVKLRRRPSPRPDTRSKGMSKIDFHQHCTHDDEEGLGQLLECNKEWTVERGVLLCLRLIGDTRKDVKRRNEWVLAMGKKYPDQVVPFCTVIEDDPKAPQMFEECLNAGAKGLKLIGWHSDYIKKHDYNLRHPSLLEIYRKAAARGVPVLAHIWIGYSDTKHDYLCDLDLILTENPSLIFVLAHFGLGFDPLSLPGLGILASKHPLLHFDTSLYGAHCELWFSRASNQAKALGNFVRAFPNQVLFGSDVFATRMKRPYEYNDALRGSVALVELEELACPEFRKTEYFTNNFSDKYGRVDFNPYHLFGLNVNVDQELELLEKIMYENAARILKLPKPSYRLTMNAAASSSS